MSDRPIIGLTMRLELETRRFYLGRDYSEALEDAGAAPVHIPLFPKRDFIAKVLDGLDGVLLPGSDSDVDPIYYGEDPHAKLGHVIPEKDETDLLVLEEAERLGLPVLAICYGMQSLNVSRGGSLVQDIPSQIDGAMLHNQGRPLDRNSHGIKIAGEGILASLCGSGTSQDLKVNSHHHQAIRTVGKNLVETAWANDGVVECIEDDRPGRFVFGVQWHPELSWKTDVLSRAIFVRFIEECKSRSAAPLSKRAG